MKVIWWLIGNVMVGAAATGSAIATRDADNFALFVICTLILLMLLRHALRLHFANERREAQRAAEAAIAWRGGNR